MDACSTGLMRVFHQCIRLLIEAHLALRAIMDISAPAISLPDRPRTGRLDHQCSHAPGRAISPLLLGARGAGLSVWSALASSWRSGRSRSAHSATLAGNPGGQVINSGEECPQDGDVFAL